MEQKGNAVEQKKKTKANSDKKRSTHGATIREKMTKEERIHKLEEKKLKREVTTFLGLCKVILDSKFFLVCIHKTLIKTFIAAREVAKSSSES